MKVFVHRASITSGMALVATGRTAEAATKQLDGLVEAYYDCLLRAYPHPDGDDPDDNGFNEWKRAEVVYDEVVETKLAE